LEKHTIGTLYAPLFGVGSEQGSIVYPEMFYKSWTVKKIMYTIALFLILGCGAKSSDSGAGSSSSNIQTYNGYLRNVDGTPISGAIVTIMGVRAAATTDSNGMSQFQAGSLFGDVVLEIIGNWGRLEVILEGIPANAESIDYQIVLDTLTLSAAVSSLDITEREVKPPPPSASLFTAARCGVCHEPRAETQCELETWKKDHVSIYDCSTASVPLDDENGEVPDPALEDPSPRPTPKKTPQNNPINGNDKYKTGLCVSCHSYNGNPKCGNAAWESIHKTVYKCSSSTPDKKKDDKKKKKTKSAITDYSELAQFLNSMN